MRIGKSAGVVVFLAAVLACSQLASGLVIRAGDDVAVGDSEEIGDDVLLMGRNVRVSGAVLHDVIAFGEDISIVGPVGGSVTAVGRRVDVVGHVGHSLKAAGSEISIDGEIGGNAMLAGATVRAAGTAKVGKDLMLCADEATILGAVDGGMRALCSRLDVAGKIKGDVGAQVREIIVRPEAEIGGDLRYESLEEGQISPKATIGGRKLWKQPRAHVRRSLRSTVAGKIAFAVWSILALGLLGTIMIAVSPRGVARVATLTYASFGWSLLWGFVFLVCLPVAAILVMITVIGLPSGILGLILYGVLLYVGRIFCACALGRLILRGGRRESRGLLIGATFLGVSILTIATGIPFVGWAIGLLAVILGAGAVLVSLKRPAPQEKAAPA